MLEITEILSARTIEPEPGVPYRAGVVVLKDTATQEEREIEFAVLADEGDEARVLAVTFEIDRLWDAAAPRNQVDKRLRAALDAGTLTVDDLPDIVGRLIE
jgi:hypothetical protein